VAEITYDGGSAGYADALPDMTIYVGSTAGAYDKGKGMVRLRGTLSGVSGTMLIGETSEINWADDDYLTVVDEFALWPRHVRTTSAGVVYMDYDDAYSDQHANCDPAPVLGPPAVEWLTGATVSVTFDASDSWVVGSTITAYSWAAPGASATSGMSTATPTITYNAAGTYRVGCAVTAANGKSFIGYRYVFIYDAAHPPTTAFRLDSCSGAWDSGGWSFRVTLWDEAQRSEIRDRALVVLFAKDWYGATEASIGPVSDRENVVAVGWIAGESVVWDPKQGSVSFEVQGPQWWLNRMSGFPSGVEDVAGTPDAWTEFSDLTVDRGLWHLLHWRTTALRCMDVRLSGDTRQIKVFDAPVGMLWQQLSRAADEMILAQPCCDRYGRLFIEIDAQYVPESDRGVIPIVQALTTADWHDALRITRRTVEDVGLLDLSGVSYADGSATALFSLSHGHVPGLYGGIERRERLALADQSQANALAGLILGRRNNTYPAFDVSLAANHRAFDVTPRQYAQLTVQASDTERGIVLTDFKIIPRRISFSHNVETGTLLTDVEFEGISTEMEGIVGDPPPEPPDPSAPPDFPPSPPPPEPPEPLQGIVALSKDQLIASFDFFTSEPTWIDITGTGLSGTFYNVVVFGLEAYVTTDSGLFYCDDFGADTPVWTCVKTNADAQTEAGYAGSFGGLAINDDGTLICAPFHATVAGSVCHVLFGSGLSWTWSTVSSLSGYPFWSPTPDNEHNHAVCYDGEFYIGGGYYYKVGDIRPYVVHSADGSGWDAISFYAVMNGAADFVSPVYGGYLTSPQDTGKLWYGWDPGTEMGIVDVRVVYGIHAFSGLALWGGTPGGVDIRPEKLYRMDIEVADASLVFGYAIRGGGSQFVLDSIDDIVWIASDPVVPSEVAGFIVYTDDGGETWMDKSGDLANWSGASTGSGSWTGNALCREFEY
jgi:hypothetical protein